MWSIFTSSLKKRCGLPHPIWMSLNCWKCTNSQRRWCKPFFPLASVQTWCHLIIHNPVWIPSPRSTVQVLFFLTDAPQPLDLLVSKAGEHSVMLTSMPHRQSWLQLVVVVVAAVVAVACCWPGPSIKGSHPLGGRVPACLQSRSTTMERHQIIDT